MSRFARCMATLFSGPSQIYTNLLTNGSFESDETGWTKSIGSPTITTEDKYGGSKSVKAFASSSQVYAQNIAPTTGDYIYVCCRAKCTRRVTGNIGARLNMSGVTYATITAVADWTLCSFVAQVVAGGAAIECGIMNSANADGYVDRVAVINLTQYFSADASSKTKEWCDANVEPKIIWVGAT